MPLEDVVYDFDTDQWVAHRLIQARWLVRELPPPLEPPKPGQWTKKPIRRRMPDKLYGRIAIAAVAAFILLGYALTQDAGWLIAMASIFLWFGLPGLLYFMLRPNHLLASKEDVRLLEDPEDRDTCLVEVVIVRDNKCVGADRGVAWFDGGRLMFNGSRTSFAIGGEDVLPRREWAERGGNRRIDACLAVPLRVPRQEADQAFVFFQPLQSYGLPKDHEERFVERLGAFRSRPPQSRGPRQWPPLS